jgi:hypothetical protein
MLSYIDLINPVYLTESFLADYKTKKAPFGQLGLIVYLRTYSRFIPELNRREHWWETVLRVVEYSMSLIPKRPRMPFAQEDLRKEAESLFVHFLLVVQKLLSPTQQAISTVATLM